MHGATSKRDTMWQSPVFTCISPNCIPANKVNRTVFRNFQLRVDLSSHCADCPLFSIEFTMGHVSGVVQSTASNMNNAGSIRNHLTEFIGSVFIISRLNIKQLLAQHIPVKCIRRLSQSNENDFKKYILNLHPVTVYPLQNRLLVIEYSDSSVAATLHSSGGSLHLRCCSKPSSQLPGRFQLSQNDVL